VTTGRWRVFKFLRLNEKCFWLLGAPLYDGKARVRMAESPTKAIGNSAISHLTHTGMQYVVPPGQARSTETYRANGREAMVATGLTEVSDLVPGTLTGFCRMPRSAAKSDDFLVMLRRKKTPECIRYH